MMESIKINRPLHSEWWKSQKISAGYDQRRFCSLGGRFYDHREKICINQALMLAERQAPVRSVLDFACGTGRISGYLAARGHKVVCCDVSESMLQEAKNRLRPTKLAQGFVLSDIYYGSFRDNAFDCVTAIRLFQHLSSDERANALAELARISRSFVLVNVMFSSPYYDCLRRLRIAVGRYATRYTASKEEILRETSLAGLKIRATILSQPLFNGNMILLLERS